MIKNYFLITLRSMMKNKLFIIINILGMGIAIADCIVGYFAYEYDATFDAIHQNRAHVYRVSAIREFENKLTRYGFAPFPLGEVVNKTFSDVDQSARVYHSWANFKRDADLFPGNISYVDPAFFQLFTFDFVAGNAPALNDKTSVVVSETMAIRLFGSPQAAFGKMITQVYGKEMKELKIAGVFKDPPMNSSFYRSDGSAYMNFDNYKDEHKDLREDDWKVEGTLFVQINDDSRVANVYKQLQPYIENNNKVREDFKIKELVLDPLTTMAHRDRADDVRTRTSWGAPPISAVIGSVVMGVLILLIACFNWTNTAIAISSRRLKEIGIRKVMGSMRKHLIVQFIGETTFICLLSLLVGLVFSDFLIRGWNYMWQYFVLTPRYTDPTFLSFLLGILVFTGILAGSYPAFYISKFEPVDILKGKLKFGGTNNFTRTLLGMQFALSLSSIVCAIGFLQNAGFQRDYDLGFDIRRSIIAWVNDQSEFDTYRNALQSNPSILSMAGANSGIFSNRSNDPVKYKSSQLEVDIIGVGDNYLHTMGLELLEGRDFLKDSKTDQKESVIITEKMAKVFGWDQSIGKQLVWKDTVNLYVVGVVKDVYTMGLWREMEPMMIRYVLPDKYSQIVVSTKASEVNAVNTFMNNEWNKVFPNRLYNGRRMVGDVQQVDEVNLNIVYMFAFLGGIAVILSATGLFTLVSLNIIKRMKEIGVRKVLGASVANIARVVNTEFVIILLIASGLGSWAGYTMAGMIMQSIWKYYHGVNAFTFAVAICLMFLVSLGAIGYKVFTAATMNPVDSLKDE